jgi:predicted phosphodiesterase
VAIISDIHGNLVALRAAFSDIESRKVSRVVCLGDVAAVGPQPKETIEFLRKANCACVMGNTDEALAKDLPEVFGTGTPEERKKLEELDGWTRKELTNFHRRYLSTLKPTLEVRFGSTWRLLCYHGSPNSNRDGIFPTLSDEELTHRLGEYKANVFAGGHTHAQMLRRFLNSLVINPGSVGLPFQKEPSGKIRNPAIAEYAIASFSERTVSVELLSVPYSVTELRRAAKNSGMPDPNWYLSDWY